MLRRQPSPIPPATLPRVWLFTDARLGDEIFAAAASLPPGSGIIVRHDDLALGRRWRLFRRLARLARLRSLIIMLAGSPAAARRWGADGVYLRQHWARHAAQARRLGLIVSMPVHNVREAHAVQRVGADIAFVSPLYPTRSHPGATALGPAAWLALARMSSAQPVALGGLTAARARALSRAATSSRIMPGWAAIDYWQEKAAKRRR